MATRVGPRRKPWSGARPQTWTVDGWTGMYDSRAQKAERDGEAPIIVNMRPVDTDRGGALQVRPGLTRLATPTTTQMPAGAVVQGMARQNTSAGGDKIILVAGGQVYSLNTTTGALTTELTTAQLTGAAITLNSTLRVWIVEFNRLAVFADMGNNAPFTWDGTTGGGLTKLTNAPASRWGGPTVYYAKLFFIKASDFRTIVWSEENQANTGYEAGGFNNAWTLSQTSGSLINRILGTNEGLYYFRSDSVGVIRGAVSTTFATDGVHDSITQQSGFRQSGANSHDPVWAAGGVWWWSNDGHPMVFRPDAGTVDLGRQMPRRWGGGAMGSSAPEETYLGSIGEHYFNADTFNGCLVLVDKNSERVHFEMTGAARRAVLVFDAVSLKLLYEDVYLANKPNTLMVWAAIIPTSAGISPLFKLVGDANGFLFREMLSEGSGLSAIGFDETENTAGTAVTGTLIGPMHGWGVITEWQFTQLDVVADALPNNSLTVGYITSRQHKASLTAADQTVADTASNTPYERRRPFGLNVNGRWCRPVIQLAGEATTNRLPQLHGYALTGYPVSGGPSVT